MKPLVIALTLAMLTSCGETEPRLNWQQMCKEYTTPGERPTSYAAKD